jgi:hypothetical protein
MIRRWHADPFGFLQQLRRQLISELAGKTKPRG